MKRSALITRFRAYRSYMRELQARTLGHRISMLNFRDWVYQRGYE